MLQITIPAAEHYDERTNRFIKTKEQTLQLEHSLVSLSKWESKWCKPFLGKNKMTRAETIDYIRCMTLTQNVDPKVYLSLTNENVDAVREYIESPMTATTINEGKTGGGREIITAEIIYYWMVAFNIPFECQKWHLNRLLTLIRVCDIKNRPNKKMNKKDLMSRNRALNEARKKSLNTKG